MTDQQMIEQRGIRTAYMCGRERILESGMWLPLQMLYEQMVGKKEIEPISKDPRKAEYWKEVCVANPVEPKFKKIWRAQALYLYDLIKQDEEEKG